MGEYFVFANLDKKEYIVPDSGAKLWEIATDFQGAGILAYLLARGEIVVSRFNRTTTNPNERDKLLEQGWKLTNTLRLTDYTIWNLSHEAKYFGRWSGDRIVVIGDYDKSGLHREIVNSFKDVSKEAYREFYIFTGDFDEILENSYLKAASQT